MEKIEHSTVPTNGINMHIASIGTGPTVLMIHGFPGLWYSWRHQLLFFGSRGYRAIAPDLRGYGDSDAPPCISSYTVLHIVGDLIGLLDHLGIDQVFLVGHDWGATIAWHLSLFRPDRIKALVNLSVAFNPRNPTIRIVEGLRALYGDELYICRFQEPGEMESDFSGIDAETLIKVFLLTFDKPHPAIIPKDTGIRSLIPPADTLPTWLSQDELNYFASKFSKTGFTGGLNYYRSLDLSWELTAAWTGAKIKVPVKFISGDRDIAYNMLHTKEYIENGGFKRDVPSLEVVIMEGVGHFINQEKPQEINQHLHDFFNKF